MISNETILHPHIFRSSLDYYYLDKGEKTITITRSRLQFCTDSRWAFFMFRRAVLWDFFLLFFWCLLNLVGRHGEAWGSHRSTVRQRVYYTAVKCVQVRAKVWASLLKSAQGPQKKGLRALSCTTKSSHGTPSFTPLPRFRPYPNLPAWVWGSAIHVPSWPHSKGVPCRLSARQGMHPLSIKIAPPPPRKLG